MHEVRACIRTWTNGNRARQFPHSLIWQYVRVGLLADRVCLPVMRPHLRTETAMSLVDRRQRSRRESGEAARKVATVLKMRRTFGADTARAFCKRMGLAEEATLALLALKSERRLRVRRAVPYCHRCARVSGFGRPAACLCSVR